MFNRERQIEHLRANMDRRPIVVAPYDAELFGHWWYEGPMFLELLFRKLHYDQGAVAPITPSGYLREYPTNQVATPSLSSWGEKGYGDYWCNGSNAWVYRHLHKMAERMVELAPPLPEGATALAAARARPGRARSDARAVERLGVHHEDRDDGALREEADRGPRDALHAPLRRAPERVDRRKWLAEVERRDNLFPDVDYRVYAT